VKLTRSAEDCKPKRFCRILNFCALLAGKADDVTCRAQEEHGSSISGNAEAIGGGLEGKPADVFNVRV
jgi:hypothetical protein